MDFRSSPVAFVRSSVSPSTRCPRRWRRHSPLSPSFRYGPKPPRSSSESSTWRPEGQELHMKAEANLSLCVCVCLPRDDLDLAVQSGDWKEVREFYLTTFNSFIEINAAFKVKQTLLSSSLSNALSLIPIPPSCSFSFLNCVFSCRKPPMAACFCFLVSVFLPLSNWSFSVFCGVTPATSHKTPCDVTCWGGGALPHVLMLIEKDTVDGVKCIFRDFWNISGSNGGGARLHLQTVLGIGNCVEPRLFFSLLVFLFLSFPARSKWIFQYDWRFGARRQICERCLRCAALHSEHRWPFREHSCCTLTVNTWLTNRCL